MYESKQSWTAFQSSKLFHINMGRYKSRWIWLWSIIHMQNLTAKWKIQMQSSMSTFYWTSSQKDINIGNYNMINYHWTHWTLQNIIQAFFRLRTSPQQRSAIIQYTERFGRIGIESTTESSLVTMRRKTSMILFFTKLWWVSVFLFFFFFCSILRRWESFPAFNKLPDFWLDSWSHNTYICISPCWQKYLAKNMCVFVCVRLFWRIWLMHNVIIDDLTHEFWHSEKKKKLEI